MDISSEKDVLSRIKLFTWYSAVDFGNGIIANTNHLSSYCVGPDSIQTGEGKWHYIIRRNLPNLQGKRVLDLGCNNGIMCIMAARAGAIDIVGIDNDSKWKNWMKQAEFTKEALEWRCKAKYPITFINADITDLPKLNLGCFDVVLGLCCLYYLPGDNLLNLLQYLQRNTTHIVIQCNTSGVHSKEINQRATPRYMGDALKKSGFKLIFKDYEKKDWKFIVIGKKI